MIKAFLNKWLTAGIHSSMDDNIRRKVFLTNVLAIFVAVFAMLVTINDIFNVEMYSSAYRRICIVLIMIIVLQVNKKGYYALSKMIFLFFPAFIQFGIPIIIADITDSQFVWFHYASAIFCAVPFLLFNQETEKVYILIFFTYYLIITLFIDQFLLFSADAPLAIEAIINDFTRYKFPPLFIAFFSSAIIMWYNETNINYEKKLKAAHEDLKETYEELIAKNEQFENINKNLEEIVQQRTEVIETKNRQIIDYANINAHKVRGPLARILGLINISAYSKDETELKEIIKKIDGPAKELNEIIDEINKTLSDNGEN